MLKETGSRSNRRFFLDFQAVPVHQVVVFSAFNDKYLPMSALILWSRGGRALQGHADVEHLQKWSKAAGIERSSPAK